MSDSGSLPWAARARRIGMLVPSTNTNAEPVTAAIVAQIPHVEVFTSRFRLPISLSEAIDTEVLGESLSMIGDVRPDVIAFHGTAGYWTGIERDAVLGQSLATATGAAFGTTATQAMMAALGALSIRRVSLVYPGSAAVLDGAALALSARGFDVVGRSALPADLSNPEIAALPPREVEALVARGAHPGADAVLCLGTNFKTGYLVDRMEQSLGQRVLDSAITLAWQLVREAGISDRIRGWGSLFETH